MGLLDNANWNDPILAMAAGLLGSQTLGQGLSRGLLGGMQAERAGQQNQMRQMLFQSQMEENRAQAEQRRALAAKAQRDAEDAAKFEGWTAKAMNPGAEIPDGFKMLGPGSNLQNFQRQPGAFPPELLALAARTGKLDELRKISESNNWGRQKVGRVIDVQGPDGRPMQQQIDEFGQPVGAPMPKPYERRLEDMGGTKQPYDPYTGGLTGTALPKTMTPDAVASNQLGWANNRIAAGNLGVAQAGLGLRQQELNQGKWQYDAERGIVTNPLTGEARPVTMGNQPIGPKGQASSQQRVTEATDALALIDQARQLIPSSTNSYAGAGVDQVARVFGKSTQGAQAAAQLKAIEGALIAKMPKMSGPQSDKDVLLYRQMAGQVGDATLPAETRLAALQTIEEIQRRYAGMGNAPIISRGNSTTVNGKVGAPAAPTVDDLLRKYGGG